MSPGIGLMKRRLESEGDAISLCKSGIIKEYGVRPDDIEILETKYHEESGDWYVAAGWPGGRVVVRMDSVFASISDISEV